MFNEMLAMGSGGGSVLIITMPETAIVSGGTYEVPVSGNIVFLSANIKRTTAISTLTVCQFVDNNGNAVSDAVSVANKDVFYNFTATSTTPASKLYLRLNSGSNASFSGTITVLVNS